MRQTTRAARPALRAFLKKLRYSIDTEARTLGPYARHKSRLGRRVTQAELATAIGVNRVWYAMLESGAMMRTSTQMLARIAAAFALNEEERVILFILAVPELEDTQLRGILVR
jgi:DNA-binding XRE family transcriptional regulator